MRTMPLIFALTLGVGCIPMPHTTTRSLEIRGRVLDARTHAPIQGAMVFLTEQERVSCKTDTAGSFWLKETHNFHMGFVPPEGHWPQQKYWSDHPVTISHTNYTPLRIDDWRENGSDKGDIFLKPKS